MNGLFHYKYCGSLYSFSYLACTSFEDQEGNLLLLRPEETIGVKLTNSWLLEPEQSALAIVVHHPEAKYFVA